MSDLQVDAHGPSEGCPAPYAVCFLAAEARKYAKRVRDLERSHERIQQCHAAQSQ